MTAIDSAAIQAGDKVKVRYKGLVSEDWQTVARAPEVGWFELDSGISFYDDGNSEVIAHQPAPRKVEVTLGEPLGCGRQFGQIHAALSPRPGSDVRLGDAQHWFHISAGDARQLALDILATVGTE
jgi:hypothetical protein